MEANVSACSLFFYSHCTNQFLVVQQNYSQQQAEIHSLHAHTVYTTVNGIAATATSHIADDNDEIMPIQTHFAST